MPATLEDRIGPLLDFLGATPLTESIAQLEFALDGLTAEDLSPVLVKQGVTVDLLRAGLDARALFGRIDDLIHAMAISLALPHLLAPGETLRRPSLGSGNDSSHPYDVETDRRIAEFKFSGWKGSDAMRKRQLFKDLVHLAAAPTDGRRAELYVTGVRPIRFLNATKSTAEWALNRGSEKTRDLFVERFGDPTIPISEFVRGAAAHVQIIDLEQRLPALFAAGPLAE